MSTSVVILGGGIGGMTAAHELIDRGFEVTVYEARGLPGGKARSMPVPDSAPSGRQPLPGEHGFRFFPGFYKHLIDTLKRIPYDGNRRGVLDNLIETTRIQIGLVDHPSITTLARFPGSLRDLRVLLEGTREFFTAAGLTYEDIDFYESRIWQLLTSCEERRQEEYQQIGWWEFIGASTRSQAYQTILGGMTRSLVAAQPHEACTKTVGDILLQMIFNLSTPGVGTDRVLNGPTNKVWIDPWRSYLEEHGVEYRLNAKAEAFHCHDGRISGVRINEEGKIREVGGDYFIAALPVEAMALLLTDEMLQIDPTLESIRVLQQDVAWMNGIQFYLKRDVRLEHGHQLFADSKWALTSLSQPQFWRKTVNLARDYGDGSVEGIISVDISDWQTPGLHAKAAIDCTREEIAAEVWAQLKSGLNTPTVMLRDEDLHFWHLDDDIHVGSFKLGKTINLEPLLVNKVNRWGMRPPARTGVPNLFLAADYVRTFTDLATMEGANEAARRAVNGILNASRARSRPCRLWKLHEPWVAKPWRWFDSRRYAKGLPWHGEFPWILRALQRLMVSATPLLVRLTRWAENVGLDQLFQRPFRS
jgi:15-cis-phytoene desaturase